MTSGGKSFNDFFENRLTKFRAQFDLQLQLIRRRKKNTSPNFFQEASCFHLSMEWAQHGRKLGKTIGRA